MDENQCRTCLGEANDTRLSVFKRVQDSSIDEMLQSLTNLKLTQDDNFSKVLCKKCFNDVISAYTFRKKCLDTERTLRGLEKKLLEIQNAQAAKIFELKQEEPKQEFGGEGPKQEFGEEESKQEIELGGEDEDLYDDEIIKNESNNEEVSPMKVVVYETQEIMDEEENYITYEIEGADDVEGYIEEYEQIEYLESDFQPSQNDENIEYDDSKGFIGHPCAFCRPLITFKTDLGLERHLFDEHQIGSNPLYCETCNVEFPVKQTDREEVINRNILKHMRHHLEGKFHPCKRCYEVFKTIKQLEIHERSHDKSSSGANQYKCKPCGIIFESLAKLNQHLSESDCRDTQEKTFKCYICNMVFNMGIAKKKHIQEMHADKAGTDCPLCLRCKIPSAVAFENHYRTHFVAPRFTCSFCGRSFHESDRLQTHIRRSHDKTPFICFWCNKPFRDKSGIARHILGVHFNNRDYKCNFCSKAFTARYNLKEHMFSVHKMAASVYKCEVCRQDFLYRKQYVRHRNSCSGVAEKPKRLSV